MQLIGTGKCGGLLLLTTVAFAHAEEPEPLAPANEQSARGHGALSIDFQDTYIRGLRVDDGTVVNAGTGRNRAVQFDLDYFVTDRWSLHAGIPYMYRHDQIVVHDYADVGAALDYRFAGKYTFSSALHKLVWGLSVNNFKYSAETRLTREF
jgi:hypothetical protein